MAHKNAEGKDVFDGKIDAIKAVRLLSGNTLPSISRIEDGGVHGDFLLKVGYIGLKEAKDLVESIMALGVSELQKDSRFIRPNVTVATPTYITNGDKQGYVTHYTLGGAIEAARNDRSVDKINFVDVDGHEETFYRNARTQTFELDVI